MQMALNIPDAHIIPPGEGEQSYTCEECQRDHARVTTMLRVTCPKPGLIRWGEQTGQRAGYKAAKAGIREQNVDKWAKSEGIHTEAIRDAGGDRGSASHKFLENYIKTGDMPLVDDFDPVYQPYMRRLSEFILAYEPEFLASEVRLVHHDLDYAGTTDGICIIHRQPPNRNKGFNLLGKRVLFDLKSNKDGRVYSPEMLYQMAAYELAWRDMGGDPNDHQVVVAVGKEKWQLKVSHFNPESFRFLCAFYHDQMLQESQNPNARKAK